VGEVVAKVIGLDSPYDHGAPYHVTHGASILAYAATFVLVSGGTVIRFLLGERRVLNVWFAVIAHDYRASKA
jgi:hypothetical protein